MPIEEPNGAATSTPPRAISSLGHRIGLASLIIMGSVFLSRILGQLRQSYIAYVGGVGRDVDAYTVAFQIPDLLNHVVAGGFLSVTFIPIFAAHLEANQEGEGWRVFSIVITAGSAFLFLLTGIAMWFTPTLVGWVAPGIVDDALTMAMAVRMTRIILPAQTCFFLGGILMAVQYANGKFFVPALAPLVYNLCIIFGGVVLAGQLGIEGFAWGVLIGACLGQFALQAFGASRVGMRYRPSLAVGHPDFARFIWMSIPLVLGLSMTFSMEFFFKFFGSMMDPGTISSLNYALRVELMLVALFGQAAGVASFPFLARLFAQGDMGRLLTTLDATIRRYVSLAIPASVLMIVAAREIVVILFKRGAFSEADVLLTTQALKIFLSGAFAMAAVNLVVRGFYATRNTWLPAVLGSLAVGLSVPLYWVFMQAYQGLGVALGVSVSALLQAVLLYVVWNRRTRNRAAATYLALARALVLSLPLGAGLWGLRWALLTLVDGDRLGGALIVCAVLGLVFLAATWLLAKLLRVTEITSLADRILSRLHRRPGPARD